jgi:hypothetical protein
MAGAKCNPDSDDMTRVVAVAACLQVSEYDVLRLAYRDWFGQLPTERELTRVFSAYLHHESIPVWVRAYLRRIEQLQASGQLDIRQLGIVSPTVVDQRSIALGALAAVVIALLISLLVYCAEQANDSAMSGCQFPPCY